MDPIDRLQLIKPYSVPSTARSIAEIITTLGLILLSYAGLYFSSCYSLWLTLLLSVPVGLLLVRVFIIQHDAGHNTLFQNPRWNHAIGLFCSLFTVTPYFFWRKAHAIHHKNSSDIGKRGVGDIDIKTIAEYDALTTWEKWQYRLMRHPLILIGIGGPLYFLFQNRYFNYKPEFRGQFNLSNIRNIYATNLACLIFYSILWYYSSLSFLLCGVLPAIWVSASVGIYLFYVQHNFDDVLYAEEHELDKLSAFKGSSFLTLPAILRWFTGSIGYHHMHHFCPRIPFYHLKASYEKLCHSFSMEEMVSKYSLLSSLKLLKLRLYDENKKRMIGWKEYKAMRNPWPDT